MNNQSDRVQWVTRALILALTAPTEKKAAECAAIAEELSASLTTLEVDKAKADALQATEN